MATLTKKRKSYYARIRWYENDYQQEKSVPLRTNLKSEALIRKNEVEEYEDTIKKGEDYTVLLSWLNKDGGKTKIVRRSLQQTIDEYHKFKEVSGIRSSTINRSEYSLRTLTDVVGCTMPVAKLKESHITDWKEEWQYKHSPNTRQLNLNKIKAFLNYCYRKEYIKSKIFIERINQKKTKAHRGKKNHLHKNSVTHTASHLRGCTVGAEDFEIIQARQPIEAGVPRMQRLDVAGAHFPVTHEKVIFTSSLVTMFPLGNLGEGGLIP